MPTHPPPWPGRRAVGLILACHPLPCLAVTAFATGYGAAVGLPPARLGLLAAAVLTGQLSIGWCNDAVDAARDSTAGRRDKPVPRGLVGRRVVGSAAGLALVASLGCSLALGVVPGLTHLGAVACGWLYDLGLKSTPASPLAYLVAFGVLPGVATTAAEPPHPPPVSVTVAAALLGCAAHFANTVGDTAADAATGVRGLPQRVGPRRSLQVTALGVAAAATVLLTGVLGGTAHPRPLGVGLLVAGVLTATAALAVTVGSGPLRRGRPPAGRSAFRITLAAVALVVVGLLVAAPGPASAVG